MTCLTAGEETGGWRVVQDATGRCIARLTENGVAINYDLGHLRCWERLGDRRGLPVQKSPLVV